MADPITRREVILGCSTAATGGALGALAARTLATPSKPRQRVLRVAHLTDIHVQPELQGGEGMAACLRHVRQLDPPPELILNGGDAIMDAFDADQARTRTQWDLWQKILRDECGTPIEHCLGNHDVWGWNRAKSGATGNEPLYGKQWALDVLGLKERFRSFDRAGWHFIVLDSTHALGGGYTARLDDAQFDWLQADLRATPAATPVLVLSHIPILCACAFFDGSNESTGDWVVPGSWMHIDARRIKTLFDKHANVKLCLSGHIHLQDRVEYNGVTYLCNGAVCGNWWRGPYHECPAGYGVIDLYADGGFNARYVPYVWK